MVTSLVFSGSQKKVSSDSVFGSGDAVILDGEVTSFVHSASGSQKKDKSVTDFVRGDTGDEMSFMGGAIQRDTTCCISASCEGTDVVMIFLAGMAFRETTSWIGGDVIVVLMISEDG